MRAPENLAVINVGGDGSKRCSRIIWDVFGLGGSERPLPPPGVYTDPWAGVLVIVSAVVAAACIWTCVGAEAGRRASRPARGRAPEVPCDRR